MNGALTRTIILAQHGKIPAEREFLDLVRFLALQNTNFIPMILSELDDSPISDPRSRSLA